MKNYLAFDIGTSNGRGMIGSFDGKKIELNVLTRFENGYVHVRDHYFWDALALFSQIKHSLRQAASHYKGSLAGIGIDTWGVDFGLLDANGNMLANPYCYRDPHTDPMMAEAFQRASREEIFEITGLQFMPLNTLYQLLAISLSGSRVLDIAHKFLMMPDLLSYWLTGVVRSEHTNSSVTQLYDARKREWSYPLIHKMGLPEHIFPEIIKPGCVLSPLHPQIMEEVGLPGVPVIAVGSHDTASAVVSVPSVEPGFAYLSSGTWGLLGVELQEPLLAPKVMEYNFGNEGGVFHTIRLLRNIVNLWLLQECRRIWNLSGETLSWDTINAMAEQAEPFTAWIDPDAPEFIVPDHMPAAIQAYCQRTGQTVPQTKGEITRVILESLACKYRYTMEELGDIQGYYPNTLHIIGGGAQNSLLCQFAANAVRRPVQAGPYEATALGNLTMQMIGTGDLSNLNEGRQLIKESFPTQTYLPQDTNLWEDQYHAFLRATGLPEIPNSTI